MMSLEGRFHHNIAEPEKHGGEDTEQPERQQPDAAVMHIHDHPGRQGTGAEGTNNWPRAGIDQMPGMFVVRVVSGARGISSFYHVRFSGHW